LYTVALRPQDATTLALVRESNLLVVLSANDSAAEVSVQSDRLTVFGPEPATDSGAGTEQARETAGAAAPTESAPAASAPSN
jgi:hypothetical protein